MTAQQPVAALTTEEASRLAVSTLEWGRDHRLGALTVAVLDAGGHPKVMLRDDGSEFLRVDIAIGKAWGALGMGLPSRLLAEKAVHVPHFVASLSVMSNGRVVPVPGGVIIRRRGSVIGAVGVSGDTSDNDELAAVQGVAAVGLQADIGEKEEWRRP